MKCNLHEIKLQTEADSIEMVLQVLYTPKITFLIRDSTIATKNAHGSCGVKSMKPIFPL